MIIHRIRSGRSAATLGMFLLCLAGIGAVVGPGAAAGIDAASPTRSIVSDDPQTIALGGRLFQRNCSPCHGPGAVGEDTARPGGGLKPEVGHIAPALNGTGHAWHHPPEYFFQMIRDGTFRTNSRMMGWKGRMKDFEILAVVSYFQSLWPAHIKEAYRQRFVSAMP